MTLFSLSNKKTSPFSTSEELFPFPSGLDNHQGQCLSVSSEIRALCNFNFLLIRLSKLKKIYDNISFIRQYVMYNICVYIVQINLKTYSQLLSHFCEKQQRTWFCLQIYPTSLFTSPQFTRTSSSAPGASPSARFTRHVPSETRSGTCRCAPSAGLLTQRPRGKLHLTYI